MPYARKSIPPEFFFLSSPDLLEECGRKAVMLSFLMLRGFPVLPGAVWCGVRLPFFSEWEELARKIPLPWILRSSARTEDAKNASMAGCYRSEGPLHSPAAAAAAFERVRSIPPAAVETALHAGVEPGLPAVLVQTWKNFDAAGVALVLEGEEVHVEGAFSGNVVEGGEPEALPAELESAVAVMARASARAAGFEDGADMEWGAHRDKEGWHLALLQLRPLAASAAVVPPWMRQGTWVLDRAHHPRPLSFLHASVADLLRQRYGVSQGTWRGHLYERRDAPLPPAVRETDVPDVCLPCPGIPENLEKARQKLSQRLDAFLRFTREYLLRRRPHRPGENCMAALLRPASGILPGPRALRFCAYFPLWWDLEASGALDGEKIPAGGTDAMPPWRVFGQRVDSREQDDWVFALMMHHLRETCLAWGNEARRAGFLDAAGDVFLLAVDEILKHDFSRELVESRRRRLLSRAAWIAPERVENGVPVWPDFPSGIREIHGTAAIPGTAQGPAFPADSDVFSPPPGAVIVAHALTPQHIIHLMQAAALVLETSGKCGHAMLIARELGIPAVVAAKGCTRLIPPGALVRVDGFSGRVGW